MIRCPNCGAENLDNATYCGVCETDLSGLKFFSVVSTAEEQQYAPEKRRWGKIVAIILVTVVVAAAVCFGYKEVTRPISISISRTHVAPQQNSIKFEWTTTKPGDSRINYGTTPSYGNTIYDPTMVTEHSMTVGGLEAGTLYYYEIVSTDSLGNTDREAGAIMTWPSTFG